MPPKKEIWLPLYFDRQSDSQISFAGGIAMQYALTPIKNMYKDMYKSMYNFCIFGICFAQGIDPSYIFTKNN
jgi:hypothetical protein